MTSPIFEGLRTQKDILVFKTNDNPKSTESGVSISIHTSTDTECSTMMNLKVRVPCVQGFRDKNC